MGPCRQTVVLMESSQESCSAEEAGGQQGLQAWVDQVNGECCLQHGIDVCREGSEVPWTCNAVCATAFIPFAEQCLGFGPGGSPPPPSPQVAAFRTLCASPLHFLVHMCKSHRGCLGRADTTCSNMNQNSPQDVSALLGDVNELADNSHCHIDTSHIVSVSSKAFAHHDQSVG